MKIGTTARGSALLGVLLVLLSLGAASAAASRLRLTQQAIAPPTVPQAIPEGACGAAFGNGQLYVSDYYRNAVDGFEVGSFPFSFKSQLAVGGLGGPCQLAADGGNLYANVWHSGVVRLLPTPMPIDGDESTGVAVDPATGNIYVSDRTYVAVYGADGEPLPDKTNPLRIGLGTPGVSDGLGDAYGIAVFGGKVYVPDAADNTVKVYEPAVDPAEPTAVIDGAAMPQHGFNSLVDAAVAVDPGNGHLLVLDNLQPGFENPEAAIDEFDSAGGFLGQLAQTVIDGEPSGMAVQESTSRLFVTSGNGEEGKVVVFGPYLGPPSGVFAPLTAPSAAAAPAAPAAVQAPDDPGAGRGAGTPPASASEVVQRGTLRVRFDGSLSPHSLPRHGSAPVRVAVAATIAATDDGPPPQLRQIAIAINRNGHFTPGGLPVCHLRDIQPATTANALEACRGSLVGEGQFSARVLLAQQAPFPSAGKIIAFNGILHGKPAILAHVYGTDPVPTSYTLPFAIEPAKGTYGTVLRVSLPGVTGDSGYITGLSLTLGRSFAYRGERRSYLSAGCPAPGGFPGATFPFAKATFAFAGRGSISSTLTRSCGARG
jgi:hypothetical protein